MDTANPVPPSEIPRKDDKPNFLTWANFPALISGAAVFAYVLSCLYVLSITSTFGFPIADYLELVDYVQFLPQGASNSAILILLTVLLVYSYASIFQRHSGPKVSILKLPPRWKSWFARSRVVSRRYFGLPSARKRFFRTFAAILIWAVPFSLLAQTFWGSGRLLKDEMNTKASSEVFRKGYPDPIKGRIFLHSSKYLFLWCKDSLVVAIPNVEVQMIQTPSNLPLPHFTPAPVNPSPTTTAAPLPTSPTPK
jgi:hypothetical protein